MCTLFNKNSLFCITTITGCCTTVYDYAYCRDVIGDDNDFVFEEFVRLRVAGVEEGNETEA